MRSKITIKIDEFANHLENHLSKQIYPGLFSGTAGISLFFFTYSKYKQSDYYYDLACEILEKTINNINFCTGHSFCSGISGICWLIDYLCDNEYIHAQNKEINIDLYAYLKKQAIKSAENGDFDFLHGAIGSAIYLINNEFKNIDKKFHEEILNLLNHYMIKEPNGGYWTYYWADMNKEPRINISISHGMASTCIYLIHILNKFKSKQKIIDMLDSSMKFIATQEYKDCRLSIFPTFSKEYDKMNQIINSRLGWCYGDLGIALVYWNYYKQLQVNDYKEKAIDLFTKIGHRKELNANNVTDAGLCHGSSGIGLIYYKMYLNTKIDYFREVSEYWLNVTINFLLYNDGCAGYKINNPEHSLSFLGGITGIGLYLLSQINNDYLGWENTLLIN